MAVETLAPRAMERTGLPEEAVSPFRATKGRRKIWSLLEMKPLFAERIVTIARFVFNVKEDINRHAKDDSISPLVSNTWRFQLSTVRQELKAIGLELSLDQIDRIIDVLSEIEDYSIAYVVGLVDDLDNRICDELNRSYCLILSREEAQMYKTPRKDWKLIIERFPSSINDVEEARRCFAVARYTACVFHATHIIETGLIDLGTFIGVRDPHSGWTAVSTELAKILKKDYRDLTEFERNNKPFLEQVQGTVEALKNSWRNKISHAEGKLYVMTTDFSSEIAEEILYATRAFMRKLAEGLPRSL